MPKVRMMPKVGKDATVSADNHPICFLTSVLKIAEVVSTLLLDHCQRHSLTPDSRFGLRPEYSTVHSVRNLIQFAASEIESRRSVGCYRLDVEMPLIVYGT